MTQPFVTIWELFTANTEHGYRTYVNQGGTSSGKTYTLMQVLFYYAITDNGCIITVVGQDLPNLKTGAFRDAKNIIQGSEWMSCFFKVNESGHYIQAVNGSVIEFNSYDNEQDAKSGKRDYLFVNEANGVPYAIYWQLAIRTKNAVYIDYNPTARFWVHDEVIGKQDTKLIISDHRMNVFLTEEQHKRIESIEDPELWKVYARGMTGKLTGLVLGNYTVVDGLPSQDTWRMEAYGLDWGYVNDPTALVHVVLAHGELWIDEVIYESGLTNPEIARKAKESGITRRDIIIADCAEMKSIQEVKNDGLWVVPSVKGADSVKVGLDILRRYKLNITRRSAGLREELQHYEWKKDADGRSTNKPIDKYNHAIDAIRYVALMRLRVARRGCAKAHFVQL